MADIPQKSLGVRALESILALLARLTIARFKPLVIGITGSAGKTSTKQAVVAVLSSVKRVRGSLANFNTELGFPLTILGDFTEDEVVVVSRKTGKGERKGAKLMFWLRIIIRGVWQLIVGAKAYPEVLVLEYGADKPGDISRLVRIVKPQVSVITAIGDIPVHVEFYNDIDGVVREKAKLIECLSVAGTAILNCDDPRVNKLVDRTRAAVMTFGYAQNADVVLSQFENRIEGEENGWFSGFGASFKIEYRDTFVPVRLAGSPGKAQSYAAGAAAAVGLTLGMNLVSVAEALQYFKMPKQRMHIVSGINDSIIIDDSYNASPAAMRHAIETVIDLPAKRAIGILGDMRELGPYTLTAHQMIGKLAAKAFDYLILVGEHAPLIGEAAKKMRFSAKKILLCKDASEAAEAAKLIIKKGDLVLVKGSLGIGLRKTVELLEQPLQK